MQFALVLKLAIRLNASRPSLNLLSSLVIDLKSPAQKVPPPRFLISLFAVPRPITKQTPSLVANDPSYNLEPTIFFVFWRTQ
jgi:hypothetical protein